VNWLTSREHYHIIGIVTALMGGVKHYARYLC